MAIVGGSEPGMEVWNPTDGSVQKVIDKLPSEVGGKSGINFAQLMPIKGGTELLLYGGKLVPAHFKYLNFFFNFDRICLLFVMKMKFGLLRV